MKRYLMVVALAMTGYLSVTTVQCSGIPDIQIEGLDGTFTCEGCLPDVIVVDGHHHHHDHDDD